MEYSHLDWKDHCYSLVYSKNPDDLIEETRAFEKRHLLYHIPNFYDDKIQSHEALWGKIQGTALKRAWDAQHSSELRLKRLVASERSRRKEQNWRLLFWGIILHRRMREFRDRFWAPGGKKMREIEKDWDAAKN